MQVAAVIALAAVALVTGTLMVTVMSAVTVLWGVVGIANFVLGVAVLM